MVYFGIDRNNNCGRASPRVCSPGAKWGRIWGMANTLGIMITMTTYGTWLRGDQRGWVDDGQILPENPIIEEADRKRMKHPVFLFEEDQFYEVGDFIGKSLTERLNLRVWALAVQSWHVHLLIGATTHSVADVVKCTKDSVRWGLRPNRPIWTEGYDKRFCFDEKTLWNRIHYIEKHNANCKSWPFIESPPFSPP